MAERISTITAHFASVTQAPDDPILGISAQYKEDTSPSKVDLVVGAYRTEEGKPWVLPVVRKVETVILNENMDHEYLPIEGLASFSSGASSLILGKNSPAVAEKRVASVQALSGTGSLRVGGEFLKNHYNANATVYIPDPTWANHTNVFKDSGLNVKSYRYFNKSTNGLDIDGLVEDIKAAPEGSIILLHACAHNPTGVDPDQEQWQKICSVIQEKKHLTFFDSAYQGFASGDIDKDAFAVRLFESKGLEFLVAQSFAKNMGLYGERIGNLSVVVSSPEIALKVKSQLKRTVRGMVSNSPAQGARIASRILNSPELYAEWEQNVKEMAGRIHTMRQLLFNEIKELGTPGSWVHILNQIGMFTFTGLTPTQVKAMIEKYHIYLTTNGRISMADRKSVV